MLRNDVLTQTYIAIRRTKCPHLVTNFMRLSPGGSNICLSELSVTCGVHSSLLKTTSQDPLTGGERTHIREISLEMDDEASSSPDCWASVAQLGIQFQDSGMSVLILARMKGIHF